MSSRALAVEEIHAISRLLLAAASNRCAAVSLNIPDEVVSGGCSPEQMLSWVRLLNLAATPEVLRLSLQGLTDTSPAIAMLRFLALTAWETEEDRDKMDMLVTWLAARWYPDPGKGEPEDELCSKIEQYLAPDRAPALTSDASDAIGKFRALRARVANATSLHQLVASGIYREARALKQETGQWFSHPRVLAAAATWNRTFAAALERLFLQGVLEATSQK
jgi:hypothetical protein